MSWITPVAAFALGLILTPLVIRLSHMNEWFDHSDHRKIHSGQIPRLGGISIFLASMITILLRHVLKHDAPTEIWIFLGAATLIFAVGLYDDFSNIRPKIKLLVQMTGAILLLSAGGWFDSSIVPLSGIVVRLGYFGAAITFVWLVGMSNAMNLIDGMDGLSGGVSAIIAGGFGIAFAIRGNAPSAAIGLSLAGALLGFLVYNRPTARIFMGDGGALFLGFALAGLPLLMTGARGYDKLFLVSVTPFLIPIFDTFAAIIRRYRRRTTFYTPDKEHLHHKLLDLGVGTWGILGIVYTITGGLTSVSLWYGLSDSVWSEAAVLASWIVTFALFIALHVAYRRRHPEIPRPVNGETPE